MLSSSIFTTLNNNKRILDNLLRLAISLVINRRSTFHLLPVYNYRTFEKKGHAQFLWDILSFNWVTLSYK